MFLDNFCYWWARHKNNRETSCVNGMHACSILLGSSPAKRKGKKNLFHKPQLTSEVDTSRWWKKKSSFWFWFGMDGEGSSSSSSGAGMTMANKEKQRTSRKKLWWNLFERRERYTKKEIEFFRILEFEFFRGIEIWWGFCGAVKRFGGL